MSAKNGSVLLITILYYIGTITTDILYPIYETSKDLNGVRREKPTKSCRDIGFFRIISACCQIHRAKVWEIKFWLFPLGVISTQMFEVWKILRLMDFQFGFRRCQYFKKVALTIYLRQLEKALTCEWHVDMLISFGELNM